MTDPVEAQYEAYPYPARDPRDEAKRLVTGSPSHLDELNHYLFAGRLFSDGLFTGRPLGKGRDPARPFRALVAGGGTGDAAIMLAQQLAEREIPGEVVHLDRSVAARGIAEARAAHRGLRNLSFVTGDLTGLAGLGLGAFDYIDCCGVLHHLEDPPAGLRALAGALAPGGGLGAMVYGAHGRTGLYPLQETLRRLAGDADLAGQVGLARRLLEGLPATNWFRRNPFLGDHKRGDAELVDLLLHRRDRAYTVPQFFELADGAGLAVTAFIEPLRYRPESYLKDPALRARLATLSWRERAGVAEVLAGNLKKHVAYLVPAADPAAAPAAARAGAPAGAPAGGEVEGPGSIRLARPATPGQVPLLPGQEGPALARACRQSLSLKVQLDGLALALPLPRLAPAILARIDGRSSLGAIHEGLRQADPRLDWLAFLAAFQAVFEPLNGINALLLRESTLGAPADSDAPADSGAPADPTAKTGDRDD